MFSAVCPKDHLPASACLEKTEANSPQIPAASPAAAQSISMTPEGSCPSILDFGLGADPSRPSAWEHKGVTPKNKQRTEMHREGELHIHIFYPDGATRAARPQPCHQPFWEQNPLFSFKISVFITQPTLTLLGSQQDTATPLQSPLLSMMRHFISHKIYTKHY